MTVTARRFTIAGTAAALLALLSCTVCLQAQDKDLRRAIPGIFQKSATPGISSKPSPKAASDSSNASAAESSLTASEVQEKVSETIDGIKSGEISTAKHAEEFDNFIQETFIRISDCMTLCKQEMVLARESAKQEATQTAKDIIVKSKDVVIEKGGKAIWESLPDLISSENMDSLSEHLNESPGKRNALFEFLHLNASPERPKDATGQPDDEPEEEDR